MPGLTVFEPGLVDPARVRRGREPRRRLGSTLRSLPLRSAGWRGAAPEVSGDLLRLRHQISERLIEQRVSLGYGGGVDNDPRRVKPGALFEG